MPRKAPTEEIDGFILAAKRVTESRAHLYFTPSNPFRDWFNGNLRILWEKARSRHGRRYYGDPVASGFLGGAELDKDRRGRAAIERWAAGWKLVDQRGNPLAWLVDSVDQEFRMLANLSGANLLPEVEYVRLPSLDRKPGESRDRWTRRRFRAAAEEYLKSTVEPAPQEPMGKRGTYSEYNREALVLGLCGIGWKVIFDRYKSLPRCKWTNPLGPEDGARAVAARLGIRWPLGLPKSGAPKKRT